MVRREKEAGEIRTHRGRFFFFIGAASPTFRESRPRNRVRAIAFETKRSDAATRDSRFPAGNVFPKTLDRIRDGSRNFARTKLTGRVRVRFEGVTRTRRGAIVQLKIL